MPAYAVLRPVGGDASARTHSGETRVVQRVRSNDGAASLSAAAVQAAHGGGHPATGRSPAGGKRRLGDTAPSPAGGAPASRFGRIAASSVSRVSAQSSQELLR